MKVNTYLIFTWYLRSSTSDSQPYVTLGCERGGENKPRTKQRVNDEEEVPMKRRGPYGTQKCGRPFKLKGEQMTTAQKIYNIVAKIKKNRMHGQNTVEEVQYAIVGGCMDDFDGWTILRLFGRTLEIGNEHLCSQEKDMDFEMRDLAFLLDQISTGPISKVREMQEPSLSLTSPPRLQPQNDEGRQTQQKGTSRIGSTCQLLIEKYKSQAVLVRVSALDSVWVPVGEANCHELLGVGVEGVAVDEVVYLLI
ncbi:hypothetical protein M9H77_05163 [Catharanthus roseus]|uniref:Uncharacterized protein n=1 Tax=Catharanthus roseus TaxID=4058 RepID=A0ACC0CG96_CATRO|nr:hypothetical protein M9H77_05163 [Catharanthus roseus]